MRGFLPLFVGAALALVAHIRGGGAELAIGADGKYHDVAGSVVGNEQVLAGFVERQITGILAERRHLIQQRKLSAFPIQRECAHHARLACFAPLAEAYFLSSSFSSCKTAAAATESSSSRRNKRTPCVERPASRISFE